MFNVKVNYGRHKTLPLILDSRVNAAQELV